MRSDQAEAREGEMQTLEDGKVGDAFACALYLIIELHSTTNLCWFGAALRVSKGWRYNTNRWHSTHFASRNEVLGIAVDKTLTQTGDVIVDLLRFVQKGNEHHTRHGVEVLILHLVGLPDIVEMANGFIEPLLKFNIH